MIVDFPRVRARVIAAREHGLQIQAHRTVSRQQGNARRGQRVGRLDWVAEDEGKRKPREPSSCAIARSPTIWMVAVPLAGCECYVMLR